MDVMHRAGDGLHQLGGVPRGQWLGKAIGQRSARYVFEHEQEPVIGLAHFEERDDVRMPHQRRGLSLTQPLPPFTRTGPPSAGEQLEGYLSPRRITASQVHHAHRPSAKFALDRETIDLRKPSVREARPVPRERCRPSSTERSMNFRHSVHLSMWLRFREDMIRRTRRPDPSELFPAWATRCHGFLSPSGGDESARPRRFVGGLPPAAIFHVFGSGIRCGVLESQAAAVRSAARIRSRPARTRPNGPA